MKSKIANNMEQQIKEFCLVKSFNNIDVMQRYIMEMVKEGYVVYSVTPYNNLSKINRDEVNHFLLVMKYTY